MDLDYRITIIILFGLLAVYGFFTIPELFTDEYYPDYDFVKIVIENYPSKIVENHDLFMRYSMLYLSDYLFENTKVIPFLITISLLVTTFYFTRFVSKNNISGLLAVTILASSSLFRMFDTSPTYDNLWVLIYFISLYFSYRLKVWSFAIFFLSMFAKPLTLLYLPTLIIQFRKSRKIILVICSVIVLYGLTVSSTLDISWSYDGFISGLFDWWWYLFTDMYMVVMIPIVMVVMCIFTIKKFQYSMDLFFGLLLTAFAGALVEGFTNMNNEPYRYIPLLVFFAISMGYIIGIKKPTKL